MPHVMRLGTHAEKDYFTRAALWFDEILVNANLLEGTASATSYFLFGEHKPFFIDPVTYAFALDPTYIRSRDRDGRSHVKRTFKQLALRYGLTADDTTDPPRLGVGDFADDAFARRFADRVIHYQRHRCEEALQDDVDFLDDPVDVRPARLLAPYFYPAQDPAWQEVNGRLIKHACELGSDTPVWGVVCMDAAVLDQSEVVDAVAEFYQPLPCAGFCIWLTNLDESSATLGQLSGLRRLVRRLSRGTEREVVNLYGGYYSALLRFDGLSGFSHGVGYGERRDVVPVVGGGLPPAKYYLRAIHDDIYIDELLRMGSGYTPERFVDEICRCVICRGLLENGVGNLLEEYGRVVRKPFPGGSRNFPDPLVYRYTRFHFLHNRYLELRQLDGQEQPACVAQLDEAHGRFSPELGINKVFFLSTWAASLRRDVP